MRSWGGEPVVMCRSDAPLSTIAFNSWGRVIDWGACAVAMTSSVRRRDARDLVERGHALTDLRDARHAQRAHAALDRLALQLGRGDTLQNQALQLLGQRHHLVHRDAALVAGAVANAAAGAPRAGGGGDLLLRRAQRPEFVVRRGDGLLAPHADLPDQALG